MRKIFDVDDDDGTSPRCAALDEDDGENHHFPIRQGYPAVKTVKTTTVEAGCIFLLGPEVDLVRTFV